MSVKNKSFVAAAAALVGIPAVGAQVVESALDQLVVNEMRIAEISDGSRQCIVFAGVVNGGVTTFRPVTDQSGNVRLYSDVTAAIALAKKADLGGGSVVYEKVEPVGNATNPTAALKAAHKQIKAEDAKADASKAKLDADIVAAEAVGWNTAVGTPYKATYDEMVLRRVAVVEWATATQTRLTALTAALVAANIDPVTYLPTA